MTLFSKITNLLPSAGRMALLTASLCLPQQAQAEMSPWASNEGGRMRLVALPPDAKGQIRAALQIEPGAGWITYWKEPGEAGIAPQISLQPGSNVRLDKILYPVPKQIDNGPLRDIGYDGAVTLPLGLSLVDPKGPAALKTTVFIGLCNNICIPFQAEFSLALKPAAQTPAQEAMILTMADATLPAAPDAAFSVTDHSVSADGSLLHLQLQLPQGFASAPRIFVTGPEGHVLTVQTNGRFNGTTYSVDMPVGKLPAGYDIRGKQWGILVAAGTKAIETTLAFD
jgi:DsbC/DsbD-like thiol-disulfide interchange protein